MIFSGETESTNKQVAQISEIRIWMTDNHSFGYMGQESFLGNFGHDRRRELQQN